MRSNIVKNTSKLLSANVIAQIIGIAVYPILTRLYLPDDFGTLHLFLTIGGIATLFATAEYQNAILLPKSEKDAAACLHVGFLSTVTVCLLFLLLIPWAPALSDLFNAPDLKRHFWLLSPFIFAVSLWNLLNFWHTRHERFTDVSMYQVTQCVSGAGLKWGLARHTGAGLIIGTVLAPIIGLSVNMATSFKKAIRPLLHPNLRECRRMARQYANFPKYSLPRSIVNYLSGNLPVLLLTPFFGVQQIGFYGMAITLSFTPISLIVKSAHQVIFQETAQRVRQRESIRPLFKKLAAKSALISLPVLAALFLVLPSLTSWLLGAEWHVTGRYIRYMLPWLFVTILAGPISFLPDVFKKQKQALEFELLILILRLAGIAAGIATGSFILAIACYSMAGFAVITLQLLWFRQLVTTYETGI
jgi:O-antigen/teichoic acid export membrane protein